MLTVLHCKSRQNLKFKCFLDPTYLFSIISTKLVRNTSFIDIVPWFTYGGRVSWYNRNGHFLMYFNLNHRSLKQSCSFRQLLADRSVQLGLHSSTKIWWNKLSVCLLLKDVLRSKFELVQQVQAINLRKSWSFQKKAIWKVTEVFFFQRSQNNIRKILIFLV